MKSALKPKSLPKSKRTVRTTAAYEVAEEDSPLNKLRENGGHSNGLWWASKAPPGPSGIHSPKRRLPAAVVLR